MHLVRGIFTLSAFFLLVSAETGVFNAKNDTAQEPWVQLHPILRDFLNGRCNLSKRFGREDVRRPENDIPSSIQGLQNLGNACYANSLLQSLLNIEVLRDRVLSSPASSLKEIFQDYINRTKVGKINVDKLRSEWLGNNFGGQQDPSEFLGEYILPSGKLEDLFDTTSVEHESCDCGFMNTTENMKDFAIHLSLPTENNSTMADLIDRNFNSSWTVVDGAAPCKRCNGSIYVRTTRENFGPILLFSLELIQRTNFGVGKRQNFKVTDVESISVGGKRYELAAGIFHIGYSLSSGHYIAVVKKGNTFFEANDSSIRKLQGWPLNSGDIYMLLYVESTKDNEKNEQQFFRYRA